MNLVAGSVENLSPNNITIIDSQGNPLFDPYQEPEGQFGFTAAEKQLALTRKFEKEVEGRLRSILERVYGPGRAVAMVSAELDFDTREQTSVTYDNPINRSEQRIEERSEGMGLGLAEVGSLISPDTQQLAAAVTTAMSAERSLTMKLARPRSSWPRPRQG